MDFAPTEEHDAVRELARQIFADHASHERLRKIETSKDGIDRELWDALAQSNLLGLAIEESYGGSEMGLTEVSILLEEQSLTSTSDESVEILGTLFPRGHPFMWQPDRY